MTTTPTPAERGLPELPDSVNVGDKHNCTIWAYTAEQMRAYALRAIEFALTTAAGGGGEVGNG